MKLKVTIEENPEDEYKVKSSDGFDYIIRPKGGGFVLDTFLSNIDDTHKAHQGSVEFDSLGEAIGFILTGES